jgi:hypothetical protein
MNSFRTNLVALDSEGELADKPVTVYFTHHRLVRGSRDGRYGPPIEPDEPEHCEIDSVVDETTGESLDLTSEQVDDLMREALDYWYDVD